MIYFCCEENRRSLVRRHATLNGIDYIEVVDNELTGTSQESLRQRILRVFFVNKPVSTDPMVTADRQDFFNRLATLSGSQVQIRGGQRVHEIQVDDVGLYSVEHAPLNADDRTELMDGDHLQIQVTPRGDYSRYTLHLVEANSDTPLQGLDPLLAFVDFSFKVECDSGFDCRPACACPPQAASSPDINYLAKDYASFRQLMMERMALLVPEWREQNPADVGVTLVELFAYVGDYLSYRQDAIATEAYLGTARSRVSVRRHARLLDYVMHDGSNARAWVQVRVKPGVTGVPLNASLEQTSRVRFTTQLSTAPLLAEHEFQKLATANRVEIFEAMESTNLFHEHNEIQFHTWGDSSCCLPKGATRATLSGHFPQLQTRQVLVFVEQKGPRTGASADADPSRRHAVRLTRVTGLTDDLFTPPVDVTDIEWGSADALPFPFCISSRAESDGRLLENVSVALGNIVLADHGMTLPQWEELGPVPASIPALAAVAVNDCGQCNASDRRNMPPRFRPQLKERPLTQAASYDPDCPATAAFAWTMLDVRPSIYLKDSQNRRWTPKRDLLSSDAFKSEFVAEMENDGRTFIRFGDDENGMRPGDGTLIKAFYRAGNGPRGNVGVDALVHIVADTLSENQIESVSNPLPARGGTAPESLEEVRRNAPAAFREQQRAVTPDDYAAMAARHPDVQRAAATLRWTGSWHTVFLSIDRRGGRGVNAAFENELRAFLEQYRLAGHDLEIDGPLFVPLELELRVCVAAGYFRSDVTGALRKIFDNRLHADGSRGFFHPDNFSFGQPVLLSRIYAEAQRVPGVRHVDVTILRRQGAKTGELVPRSDVFDIGRVEIAQLDNDPNFPDRGVLRFETMGGQ
jgi:hypothetical protein